MNSYIERSDAILYRASILLSNKTGMKSIEAKTPHKIGGISSHWWEQAASCCRQTLRTRAAGRPSPEALLWRGGYGVERPLWVLVV